MDNRQYQSTNINGERTVVSHGASSNYVHNSNNPNTLTHSHAEEHHEDDWRYERSSNSNDIQNFNSRFADITDSLEEGYYNLNGDLYYKGQKVQSNTYRMPEYETRNDRRTGKTMNVEKKSSKAWIVVVVAIILLLSCCGGMLSDIMESMAQ